jgi:hypothetical protein
MGCKVRSAGKLEFCCAQLPCQRSKEMSVKPLKHDVCVNDSPNSCIEVHGPQLANEDVDETFAKDVKVAGGESVIDIVSSS